MTAKAPVTASAKTETKPSPPISLNGDRSNLLQRKCDCGKSTGLSGQCGDCQKKKLLQRRATDQNEVSDVPPIVHEVLQSPGQPLDRETRTFMESRFGQLGQSIQPLRPTVAKSELTVGAAGDRYEQEADRIANQVMRMPQPTLHTQGQDFSGVRIHTGLMAERSAQEVNAHAYTVGQHVVFGAGQFAPTTQRGQQLMAHELTHVVQQSGPNGIQRVQRAPVEDCGEPAFLDEEVSCKGTSRDGAGDMVDTPTGWQLRNFDIDKHFLKPEHLAGLKTILPVIQAYLHANVGKQITLVGEASTTANTCHNLRLSRRRTKCVALALQAMGIPASAIDLSWLGDIGSEARLAAKPVKTQQDIENPNDRRVSIVLAQTPSPDAECTPEAKLRASTSLEFRFGCRSRNTFSVVIADQSASPPIYREFIWEKMIAFPSSCEFFPALQPTATDLYLFQNPVRLAWTEDADSPSDFLDIVMQISRMIGSDPEHVLEFESNGKTTAVDFPGVWSPAACDADLKAGNPKATIGKLKPEGPVKCGPMPLPKSIDCTKPTEDEENCPASRRESGASHFKARTESLSLTEKVVDWLGDQVVGQEVRQFNIGTIKTEEEKQKSGDDIWRPYLFVGKIVYGPSGCEQRDPQGSARGEATVDDPEQLSEVNFRPARLTRSANSNVERLWIAGLGTFELRGEKCASGSTEILVGTVAAKGSIRCEPMQMDAPPAEQSCKEDCPAGRRVCADTKFQFKFGRLLPQNLPSALQAQLAQLGCNAEVAQVNIGTISLKPIWRPFLWVQQTQPCPFTIRGDSMFGAAGKTTLGIKPKFRFKWPPIGVEPIPPSIEGLSLATQNPDDPGAPSDFTLATELGAVLTGSGVSSSIGVSGLTVSSYQMATLGSPVDWTGSCKSSTVGLLLPIGKVECGWVPAPPHHPALPDTCPPDLSTKLVNFGYLMGHLDMLAALGNRAGMLTQLSEGRTLLYSAGQTVRGIRFVGKAFGPGGKLEPVVITFDIKVLESYIDLAANRAILRFTVLSSPCTYRWGTERMPLRLLSDRCDESIQSGATYTISSDLQELPDQP